MATEKLIIELDARTAKLDAKLKATESRLDQLDGTVKKTDKSMLSLQKTATKAARSASIVALGAIVGTGAFARYSDQIQLAENQLKSVTSSTEEFNAIQDELRRIAGDTRQSITELTTVYARFKRAGEEAGFTIQETLDLTESLTKAFKIEGNTTAEVNSVLLQLTQSFRSGVIAGEEFRAVSEGSTLVLNALASQMRVNVGDLKEMAAEGLVTPEALLRGLEGASDEINKTFDGLEITFSEVGTAMGRAFSAAYMDSWLEDTSSGMKESLSHIFKDVERFFSGQETFSGGELQQSIDKTRSKLLALRFEFIKLSADDKKSSFLPEKIAQTEFELDELLLRSDNLTRKPAHIFIDEGVEDPRIQREKDFALAVLEIHQEQAGTLEERFEREAEIHQLALDNKLINEREYQAAVNNSAKNFVKAKRVEEKADKSKLQSTRKFIQASAILNNALFEDNKAINAGLIVADTAAGIMMAFRSASSPYEAYANAAVIAATGIAQLANLNSSSKGGGSISSGSGGGGGGDAPPQESYTPDQTSIGLDFRDDEESNTVIVKFDTDSQEIGDMLVGVLNENKRQGR